MFLYETLNDKRGKIYGKNLIDKKNLEWNNETNIRTLNAKANFNN